jgi:hypothetical protein
LKLKFSPSPASCETRWCVPQSRPHLIIAAYRLMPRVVDNRMEAEGWFNSGCWWRNGRCSDSSWVVILILYFLGGGFRKGKSCASSCAQLPYLVLYVNKQSFYSVLLTSWEGPCASSCAIECLRTFFMSQPLVDIKFLFMPYWINNKFMASNSKFWMSVRSLFTTKQERELIQKSASGQRVEIGLNKNASPIRWYFLPRDKSYH